MLEPHEKHKALTRFLCQELLYEFVIGKLDLDKQKAMDEYLSTDRESQHELERLRRGFVFASQMSKTQMNAELRAALLGFEPVWKRRLAATTAWWSRRGWKILPYFVLAGVLVLGSLVMKPWVYLQQRDVVLVEEAKPSAEATPAPADAKVQPSGQVTPLKEEKDVPVKLEAAPVIPAVLPVAKKDKPTVLTEEEPAPAPSPSPMATVSPATAATAATAAAEADGVVADLPSDSTAAKPHFWVYRAKLDVNADFQIATGAIRDKITSLEGQVIGSIGLGVQRKAGEAYFHFSLPESKQKDFENFLGNFGPVRFEKQADKRGMPEGQNHIILTVKDVSPHEGKTPEAP